MAPCPACPQKKTEVFFEVVPVIFLICNCGSCYFAQVTLLLRPSTIVTSPK